MSVDNCDVEMKFRKFNPNQAVLNVCVKQTKEFKVRMWLAIGLIRLACLVAGFGYGGEDDDC